MKIPKGETAWTGYLDRKGNLLFLLTSKETRDWYFLYAAEGGELKRLGKARSPPELEAKYRVHEKMRGNR